MLRDSSAIKEQIIRELLAIIQQFPQSKSLDLGKLLLFLEKNLADMIDEEVLDLAPLWAYCQEHPPCDGPFFGNVFQKFEEKAITMNLALHWPGEVMIAAGITRPLSQERIAFARNELMKRFLTSPIMNSLRADQLDKIFENLCSQAVEPLQLQKLWDELLKLGADRQLVAEILTSLDNASFPFAIVLPEELSTQKSLPPNEAKQAVIKAILESIDNSPAGEIIDPEKLRDFLEEDLDEMWEEDAYDLQLIWDVLSDAPKITEDMLIKAFLLLEKKLDTLPVKVWIPARVRNLTPEAKAVFLPKMEKQTPPPTSSKKTTGNHASRSTGNHAARSTGNHAARKTGNYAARKTGSIKKSSTSTKRKKKGFHTEEKASPVFLFVAGIAALLIISYYLLFVRESVPSYGGTPIPATQIQKIYPLAELRAGKNFLAVKFKTGYKQIPINKLEEGEVLLWKEAAKRNINTIRFFSPRGKFLYQSTR